MYDVVIIGGGITALTTAFHLSRGGVKVAIIEKANRLGGQIRTFSKNGFIYESGPNTGVLNGVEVVELFKLVEPECMCDVACKAANKRLVLYNGKFCALPSSLIGGIITPLFSLKDKFRVLLEPFRAKGEDKNESVGDFATRRLGRSIVDYAVDPFVSGIYAGDPFKLVTRFALPKLYNLEKEYGSFIIGSIKKAPAAKKLREQGVTKEVFSAVGGLESLTKAITKKIDKKVDVFCDSQRCEVLKNETGTFDISFIYKNKKIALSSLKVITTVGAYALNELLPQVNKSVLEKVTSLEYAGVTEVAVGYNTFTMKLDSFGGLIPSKERRKVLGILHPSSCFGGRAPEGGALLSVFIGGVKNREALEYSDEQIKELVLEEIKSTMQVDTKPDLFEIFRHKSAIPQYYSSTKERYEAVEQIESEFKGLIIGGNLKGGIGLSDRIRQGKEMAENVLLDKMLSLSNKNLLSKQ